MPSEKTDSKARPGNQSGDFSDVIVAGITALVILGFLALFAFMYDEGKHLHAFLFAGAVGSALGWVIGIIISPYGSGEKEAFSSIGKLVYGFLSGYLVSKVDPIVTRFLENMGPEKTQVSETGLVVALTGFCCFLVVAALTYISRSYWTS